MDGLDFLEDMLAEGQIDIAQYQYFHQLFHHRTIVFNGSVDDNIIEKVYLPLKDFEEDDNSKPITIILNSFGGSVTEGFFLAHYLSKYKKKIDIIVTGCAASMAAVILAGCGKNPNITRKCYPNSYLLIHDGYVAIGAAESVDNDIRDFIVENTNITLEQYESHCRHQWFIKAPEALELNLIDEII